MRGKQEGVEQQNSWYAYLVLCSDQTLYAGIAKDLRKRLEAHNNGREGAKYTRSRRPVKLVYLEEFDSRSAASRRELQLKRMDRATKLKLVRGNDIQVLGAASVSDK